jgi:hypothetical protein
LLFPPVDGAAAELNRDGLQHAMSRRNPALAHDNLDPLFTVRAFERVNVQPFRIMEQPAQRSRDLPVLVSLKSGRERPGVKKYVSSEPDKLRLAVERRVVRMVER